MNNKDEHELSWQKILPGFLFLTAISIFFGTLGNNDQNISLANTCDKIEIDVDKSPSFIGGDQAVLNFNHKHILPVLSRLTNENNERISVLEYQITISKTGSIVACEITNKLSQYIKNELKNAIYKMPNWEPAIKDGENVCYNIRLPLSINWDE